MNFQGLGILIALGFFVKAVIEFTLAAVCFIIALIFKIFRQ